MTFPCGILPGYVGRKAGCDPGFFQQQSAETIQQTGKMYQCKCGQNCIYDYDYNNELKSIYKTVI